MKRFIKFLPSLPSPPLLSSLLTHSFLPSFLSTFPSFLPSFLLSSLTWLHLFPFSSSCLHTTCIHPSNFIYLIYRFFWRRGGHRTATCNERLCGQQNICQEIRYTVTWGGCDWIENSRERKEEERRIEIEREGAAGGKKWEEKMNRQQARDSIVKPLYQDYKFKQCSILPRQNKMSEE